MKVFCIDVGTNSVLFLLAKKDKRGRFTPIHFHAETTRLGKSVRKTGRLNKKYILRTVSAIKKNLKPADKYLIAGTSALREAKNRNDFVKLLYKQTGLKIKTLKENEEAVLTGKSVSHFLKPLPKKTVICDIGGGSTELIFIHNGRITKTKSFPIGAVNLTEQFNNNLKGMEAFIKGKMKKRNDIVYKLIGTGGTVTTTGAVVQRLKHYDSKKVHRFTLSLSKISRLLKYLAEIPLNKRKKILCFSPKRADIIVAGICILKVIMELFNVTKIRICDRGLVYGLGVYSK